MPSFADLDLLECPNPRGLVGLANPTSSEHIGLSRGLDEVSEQHGSRSRSLVSSVGNEHNPFAQRELRRPFDESTHERLSHLSRERVSDKTHRLVKLLTINQEMLRGDAA